MSELQNLREEVQELRDTASKFRALCVLAEKAYDECRDSNKSAGAMRALWTMLRQIERAPLMPPKGAFQVVALPRGAGATMQLAHQAFTEKAVLIVPTEAVRRSLLSRFQFLREDQVFGWWHAGENLRGHKLRRPNGRLPVYIDNADWILREQLGHDIAGISVSL